MDRDPVAVDLGLQGGGAHGAFTWGVLDRLLEESWLTFDGISGTSAGAMNAVVMAGGLAEGGAQARRGARKVLEARVRRGAAKPAAARPIESLTGRWTLDNSPVFLALDIAARVLSPYDINPSAPIRSRQILADSVHFDRLAAAPIKLFVTATNVRTGRGRVFRNAESHPTCCSPRPACRRCSRRSRSTARRTGTAATPATRP